MTCNYLQYKNAPHFLLCLARGPSNRGALGHGYLACTLIRPCHSLPHSITSVGLGHGANSGFLAVSLQVTLVIGCRYIPPAKEVTRISRYQIRHTSLTVQVDPGARQISYWHDSSASDSCLKISRTSNSLLLAESCVIFAVRN